MCIRDRLKTWCEEVQREVEVRGLPVTLSKTPGEVNTLGLPVSYTHLRAHETVLDLVCRLLLEKKKTTNIQ